MSDQDPPPPMNDNSPEQGAPPPVPSTPASNPFPTPAPPVGSVAVGQGKVSESDEKMIGMLSHLLGAFTGFVGPLIIWMIKKEESPFVNDQSKEALNFQITVAIGYVVTGVLHLLSILIFAPVACVTTLLFMALGIASLAFSILGCLDANKGKVYRYPFAIRLIT